MQKTFKIIDTNILLYNSKSIFSFPNDIVIIYFSVLNELETFKKECSERGYNARESIRILDELRKSGNLIDGIELPNNGFLKVEMFIDKNIKGLTDSVDDQIISLGLKLKSENKKVEIISQDFALRIKAGLFGLFASDYESEVISKENFYQGWKEFIYPSGDIKMKSEFILKEIQENYSFTKNEFALLKSSHKDEYYKIFRYVEKNHFIEVNLNDNFLWGILPKNPHQEMALNLLLDDSIQLVVLCGPSGTGKTFMVLASMLYKILCCNVYHKLLVSRPLVPLGPDIGYLPGDLNEKLQTWMQPIKDNLDYLLYKINENIEVSGNICINDFSYSKKKNKKNRKNFNYSNDNLNNKNYMSPRPSKITIDDLIGNYGKISLEAITYMRGRSIPNQAIFIDEVQNLTPHEVKTLISRAGEGSKIILTGDPYQIDSAYLDFVTNGLIVASEKFKNESIFGSVYLQTSERSILSSLANKLM